MTIPHNIEILNWDSSFFGFNVGRSREIDTGLTKSHIAQEMKLQNLHLLYCSSPRLLHESIANFFVLTQETFDKRISRRKQVPTNPCYSIMEYPKEPASLEIKSLAIMAGWASRFKVDPFITDERFLELYELWADRSCLREIADAVIIAKVDNALAGFATLRHTPPTSSIGLIAVSPDHQGKGIASSLLCTCEQQAVEMGSELLRVVTQSINTPAVQLYLKHGMHLSEKLHWYHIWRHRLESN